MRWKLPWPKRAGAGTRRRRRREAGRLAAPCPGLAPGRHPRTRRGGPRPQAGDGGRRAGAVRRRAVLRRNCCLGWSSCPQSKSMLLEDGQSVAAFYELVPLGTEGREPGWLAHARDALENALQDSSMNWTRTRGCSSSTPRTNPASTSTCRPCATTCSRVRAVRPSPSSICASSATTCARWPSRAACSRTRWSHGCAGAARRGVCAWWSIAARPDRDRAGKPPRPDTRADAEHRLRPPVRRPGERRHPGPAHGRGRRPRLAAAVVQSAPRAARARGRGPGALLCAGALSRQYRGKRGRRDRAGERAGFQPAAVLRPAALRRGARGLVLRRHAAPRADHRPAAHAARHRAPDRRDPQGGCHQHAVRPDARRHLDVSHDGRHAAGCPGIGSQPPGEESGGRDAGVGADAEGRAGSPLPDRQRAQALPGDAGVLPARTRRGGTGPARPGPGERDAQRRLAAGARGRRGGTAQQLLALAAVLLQPRPGSAQVVHPTDVRAARGEPVAGVGPRPGHGAPRHHDVQPRWRPDHLRPAQPPGSADERPPVPVRPHRLGQERHAQQPLEPGHGDLPAAAVHRGGRQQLRPVQRLRQAGSG